MDNSDLDILDNINTDWNDQVTVQKPSSQIKDESLQKEFEKKLEVPNRLEEARSRQKKKHLPQLIDEDTENFKNRLGKSSYLDNLINVFKTNAISEFMEMKKDLIEERDQIIKNETYRYVSMFENKS